MTQHSCPYKIGDGRNQRQQTDPSHLSPSLCILSSVLVTSNQVGTTSIWPCPVEPSLWSKHGNLSKLSLLLVKSGDVLKENLDFLIEGKAIVHS